MLIMLRPFYLLILLITHVVAAEMGRLQINVNDRQDKPVPCRVHLANATGEPVKAAGLPFFRDHFTCEGRVVLNLQPGKYTYAVERGPEFERLSGTITLKEGKPHILKLSIDRIAHQRKVGWFSGDLHVHRPLKDINLLMRAEELDFAPVITWWNKRNMWAGEAHPEAGEDVAARQGPERCQNWNQRIAGKRVKYCVFLVFCDSGSSNELPELQKMLMQLCVFLVF